MSDRPITRCCNQPRFQLTRDERVTRLATLTDEGVLLVDATPLACSGETFDNDDKHLACDNCGTEQDLEDD